MRSRFEVFAVLAFATVASSAIAKEPSRADLSAAVGRTDTTYGRIEGDVGFVVGAGVAVGPRAPRTALDLRFRYLDTIGVFVDYEDATLIGTPSEPRRVLSTGAELRPLFLGRWLTGRESGTGRLDLAVDSIGLELGAFFAQPIGASFGARPGIQAGVGIELPLFARASGPWIGLHGGVRWSDSAISGATVAGPSDRALYLAITLAWHQLFFAHAVDVGDRAPR